MAISKVIFNGDTLMDVTGDNPASDNMLTGTKATGANGQSVNGALVTAPASDTDPAMDGTASAGSASTYSRGDHVHPSDTSKLGTSGNASSTTVTFTQASSRTNLSSGGTLATAFGRISKWFADLGSLAFKNSVAKTDLESSVQTSLGKADTALQSYTETDPTVPSWAKASNKPSYTASEVGAVGTSGDASSTTVTFTQASSRTNISSGGTIATAFSRISKWLSDLGSLAFKSTVSKSDLESSVQTSLGKADTALQSYTETDPTVPSWAKQSTKPSYTASEVGALPDTTTIPTASTTNPSMDGTASYGSGTSYARSNHVHPTDTTRAPLTSPGLTGIPTAPTAASGTNTTQIATTAFVQTELNEVKTSVSNGKSAIASAITDKGVSTSGSDSFATMASNIEQISNSIVNSKITSLRAYDEDVEANTFVEICYGQNNPFSVPGGNMTRKNDIIFDRYFILPTACSSTSSNTSITYSVYRISDDDGSSVLVSSGNVIRPISGRKSYLNSNIGTYSGGAIAVQLSSTTGLVMFVGGSTSYYAVADATFDGTTVTLSRLRDLYDVSNGYSYPTIINRFCKLNSTSAIFCVKDNIYMIINYGVTDVSYVTYTLDYGSYTAPSSTTYMSICYYSDNYVLFATPYTHSSIGSNNYNYLFSCIINFSDVNNITQYTMSRCGVKQNIPNVSMTVLYGYPGICRMNYGDSNAFIFAWVDSDRAFSAVKIYVNSNYSVTMQALAQTYNLLVNRFSQSYYNIQNPKIYGISNNEFICCSFVNVTSSSPYSSLLFVWICKISNNSAFIGPMIIKTVTFTYNYTSDGNYQFVPFNNNLLACARDVVVANSQVYSAATPKFIIYPERLWFSVKESVDKIDGVTKDVITYDSSGDVFACVNDERVI